MRARTHGGLSIAAHRGSSSLMASSQAACIRAAVRICENGARFCGADCASEPLECGTHRLVARFRRRIRRHETWP